MSSRGRRDTTCARSWGGAIRIPARHIGRVWCINPEIGNTLRPRPVKLCGTCGCLESHAYSIIMESRACSSGGRRAAYGGRSRRRLAFRRFGGVRQHRGSGGSVARTAGGMGIGGLGHHPGSRACRRGHRLPDYVSGRPTAAWPGIGAKRRAGAVLGSSETGCRSSGSNPTGPSVGGGGDSRCPPEGSTIPRPLPILSHRSHRPRKRRPRTLNPRAPRIRRRPVPRLPLRLKRRRTNSPASKPAAAAPHPDAAEPGIPDPSPTASPSPPDAALPAIPDGPSPTASAPFEEPPVEPPAVAQPQRAEPLPPVPAAPTGSHAETTASGAPAPSSAGSNETPADPAAVPRRAAPAVPDVGPGAAPAGAAHLSSRAKSAATARKAKTPVSSKRQAPRAQARPPAAPHRASAPAARRPARPPAAFTRQTRPVETTGAMPARARPPVRSAPPAAPREPRPFALPEALRPSGP